MAKKQAESDDIRATHHRQGDDLLNRAAVVAEALDEIDDVRLMSCSSRLGPFTQGMLALNLKYDGHARRATADGTKFVVFASFILTAAEESAEVPFLKLEATFAIVCVLKSPEGIDDKHLLAFAKTNGVFNAWPYWREFLQSMCARMGLPSIPLPVYKLGSSGIIGQIAVRAEEVANISPL